VFQQVEEIFQLESNANFHSNATTIPTDSNLNEIRFAAHHPRERIVPSPNATTIPMERDFARPLRPSNEDLGHEIYTILHTRRYIVGIHNTSPNQAKCVE